MSVTLLIVDLWLYCVCCIRSVITRCTLFMVFYLCVCASVGYTRCSVRTSVYLCSPSLQDLAVPRNLYPLSESLQNDLTDPAFDGVGLAGFKSRVDAFLFAKAALSLFVFNYFSLCLFFCL